MTFSKTIVYNDDGTYSVSLKLDEIADIVSGTKPYILLDHYDKNLEGLNKLTIYHEPCLMDSHSKLPDLEAYVLSVHKINRSFSTLIIVTLAIDCVPVEFFDNVPVMII